MVQVTQVHMEGRNGHDEHIAAVMWRNPANGKEGLTLKAAIVGFIRTGKGDVPVAGGAGCVQVGVIEASPPYIRTHAKGTWSHDLLALPRY